MNRRLALFLIMFFYSYCSFAEGKSSEGQAADLFFSGANPVYFELALASNSQSEPDFTTKSFNSFDYALPSPSTPKGEFRVVSGLNIENSSMQISFFFSTLYSSRVDSEGVSSVSISIENKTSRPIKLATSSLQLVRQDRQIELVPFGVPSSNFIPAGVRTTQAFHFSNKMDEISWLVGDREIYKNEPSISDSNRSFRLFFAVDIEGKQVFVDLPIVSKRQLIIRELGGT